MKEQEDRYLVVIENRAFIGASTITLVKLKHILLQPLRWRCVECAIHHKRDVREE